MVRAVWTTFTWPCPPVFLEADGAAMGTLLCPDAGKWPGSSLPVDGGAWGGAGTEL